VIGDIQCQGRGIPLSRAKIESTHFLLTA